MRAACLLDTRLSGSISGHEWQIVQARLGLSRRQLAIVRHLLRERSDRDIARDLCVQPATIHTHLHRLYRKLGVAGRSGVVAAVFLCLRSLEEGTPARAGYLGPCPPNGVHNGRPRSRNG